MTNLALITPHQEVDKAIENSSGLSLREATYARWTEFPAITYDEFNLLPRTIREDLIARNRILNSDGYNRVMDHLLSQREVPDNDSDSRLSVATATASYSLQLRRSPFPFQVICGIEDAVERMTSLPISRAELEFAIEFHRREGVPFFNEKMWREIVEDNHGRLPFEIYAVKDGTVTLPGEPVLSVRGPSELIAHFEHLFHRVFYETLVATKARALVEILGSPDRFIEVGLRGAVTDQQHLQALYAAYVGGGFSLTSSDAAAVVLPIKSGGTIGHRYVQTFDNEERAFRFAIDHLERVTLLIDLVESYQGIDLAVRLKEEYRDSGKKIWVRLDSGDILDQVRYYLNQTDERGLTDPERDKLVVEGIDSLEELAAIEKMIVEEFGRDALRRVMYGAGSLLISDRTSRSDASTGFKQTEYTDESGTLIPTMKFSSSPGKGSYPGDLRLVEVDGERTVAQAGELFAGEVEDHFSLLYNGGGEVDSRSTPEEARYKASREFLRFKRDEWPVTRAIPSPETEKKIQSIKAMYGLGV